MSTAGTHSKIDVEDVADENELAALDQALQQLQRLRAAVIRQYFGQPLGLTEAQLLVLTAVAAAAPEAPPSVSELADAAVVAGSSMSRIIDGLVRRGLLTRQAGADRRVSRLELTPDGSALVAQIREHGEALSEKISARIDRAEMLEYLATTAKLCANCEALLGSQQ